MRTYIDGTNYNCFIEHGKYCWRPTNPRTKDPKDSIRRFPTKDALIQFMEYIHDRNENKNGNEKTELEQIIVLLEKGDTQTAKNRLSTRKSGLTHKKLALPLINQAFTAITENNVEEAIWFIYNRIQELEKISKHMPLKIEAVQRYSPSTPLCPV